MTSKACFLDNQCSIRDAWHDYFALTLPYPKSYAENTNKLENEDGAVCRLFEQIVVVAGGCHVVARHCTLILVYRSSLLSMSVPVRVK